MRGVAIVGASEAGVFTRWLVRNLTHYGYEEPIWLINPRREELFGMKCLKSLDEIDHAPAVGVIITNPKIAVESCRELLARGTKDIVVVSAGFRESGAAEGIVAERDIADMCRAAGARLVGPNCVGFARMHEKYAGIAEPIPKNLVPGDISVVSNSGGLLSGILQGLEVCAAGIDALYSVGNGAALNLCQAVEVCADRPTTKVVCALVEGIADKDQLADTLQRGRSHGCEFVFLLLGQSESSKAMAESHTGAVLGEGRLARAWLEANGVHVVDSIHEMAQTATLLSRVGRMPPGKGVLIVSGSGGASGMCADVLGRAGVPLAVLNQQTIDKLAPLMPAGSHIGNPLDVGGPGGSERRGLVTRRACEDPSVGLLLEPFPVVWPDDDAGRQDHRDIMLYMNQAALDLGLPHVVSAVFPGAVSDFMLGLHREGRLTALPDIQVTATALRRLWADPSMPTDAKPSPRHAAGAGTISEAEGRVIAGEAGLPLVRGVHAASAEAAVAAARTMPGPWVVKIGNSEVSHKGRIGGVKVGLCDLEGVARACTEIAASAIAHGAVASAGTVSFLVQEMVSGPELLVAAVRDKVVGASMMVAIGGWAAEAGHVFFTAPLPLSVEDIERHLRTSRLAALLGPDQRRLAELLHRIGQAFMGPDMARFDVLECNPVILTSRGAVLADVLIVSADTAAHALVSAH